MEVAADPEQLLIAAERYERMCIAAAKLAVAAGASPSEAQRVSGLQRVEIKRALGPVKRQTDKLDKTAVLAGQEIPRHLVTPARVLSSQDSALAADYLQVSNYARYQCALFLYLKEINDLNQEFNRISAEFFALKDKFKQLSVDYDLLAARLNDVIKSCFGNLHPPARFMHGHVQKFSWAKRDRIIEQLQLIVRQRDSLRAQLSKTGSQVVSVMAAYQRHHARRAYLRSSVIREYRDYKTLFVSRATLYDMNSFDFQGSLVTQPDEVAKMLQLAEQWSGIQSAFADERLDMQLRHQQDQSADRTLFELVHEARTKPLAPARNRKVDMRNET